MTTEWQHQIIDRVEEVRKALGLNKSQFSARISMKPQTYNNFIGAQGSKPNVELLVGIVRVFDVNPFWLLIGGDKGGMFIQHAFEIGKPDLTPEQIEEARRQQPETNLEFLRKMHKPPIEHILDLLGCFRQDIENLGEQIVDFRRAITKDPERSGVAGPFVPEITLPELPPPYGTGFSFALDCMKENGAKMRRKMWPPGAHLILIPNGPDSALVQQWPGIQYGSRWNPATADLLAEDWEIFDG